MSAVELLWMHHADRFESLVEHSRSQVRRYLMQTKDFDRLAAWDAGQFGDHAEDGGKGDA